MTEQNQEILKRYYRGETTLQEEQRLKAAYREGTIPDHPIFAYPNQNPDFPTELTEKIHLCIHQRRTRRIRQRWAFAAGIAAILILIISLHSVLPVSSSTSILSDDLKKERFEEALRIIGKVLDEKTPLAQKGLYEDTSLNYQHKIIKN